MSTEVIALLSIAYGTFIGYAADVINLLVNKAELDEDMYGIRVQK